jgi:hypothetical protein
MKQLILSSLLLASFSALACPDFSGTYKRDDSLGCKINNKKSLRYASPLMLSVGDKQDGYISDGDEFRITQKGCESLTVHYVDEFYIDGQQNRSETIDLTKGELETSKSALNLKIKEKLTTQCYMGCSTTINKSELSLMLSKDVLRIKSVSKTRGVINAVIPWISNDKVNCAAVRIR